MAKPDALKLKTERVDVSTLTTDPANARRHDARNLEAIKGSLLRFGQQKPIVVNGKGVVVAGNGTLEAARALEWDTIEIIRTGLKGAEATAYSISDNRSSELADWDFEALAPQLQSLKNEDFDLNSLGWADHELDPLLAADWTPPEIAELPSPHGKGVKPITVTAEQREVIDRAVAKVRESDGDSTLDEGACVACICEVYLR